jgi:hypothetical protein
MEYETAPATTPEVNTENIVGASVLGVNYIVDLDDLTADMLRECWDTTGRSEVQIVLDLNSVPGRLSLANFIWLALNSSGKAVSYDAAFKLASPTAMRSAAALLGSALEAAVVASREAHPQS